MENTVSFHRKTLSPTPRRHHYKAKGVIKREPQWENDSNECRDDTDNIYVVDKIVRHISLEHGVRYIVRWYGYRNAEDTRKPLITYLNALSTRTGDESTRAKKGPCWKRPKPSTLPTTKRSQSRPYDHSELAGREGLTTVPTQISHKLRPLSSRLYQLKVPDSSTK